MKIGYFVPEFPTQTHAFFWRELTSWSSLGHEVLLVSTSRPAAGACRHEFGESARAQTRYLFPPSPLSVARAALRHVFRLPKALGYALRIPGSAKERLKNLGLLTCALDLADFASRSGMQHLHVHSCASSAHLAALCHELTGIPYSLTLHGDLSVYGTAHDMKAAKAKFVSVVTRPLQESVVETLGLDRARVPVITMGVDCSRFAESTRAATPKTLRAISIARLHPNKGHVFALRAIRKALDRGVLVDYAIVGAGDHEQAIRAECSALGLDSRVAFLGSLGESDVAKELRNSDVLLLPSIRMGEAAPVAVMEAMATGLPVVSSIIGGTPDMITDGVDGYLVPQEDVDAIAARLTELAENPELRRAVGARAAQRARRQFDYRATAKQLLDRITAP